MRKLILVRHGQYDHDTGNLTALGRRQAVTIAKVLRGVKLDAIHCSTMPRAEETAALLKRALRSRLKVRYSHTLREKMPTPVPGLTQRSDGPELRKNLHACNALTPAWLAPRGVNAPSWSWRTAT